MSRHFLWATDCTPAIKVNKIFSKRKVSICVQNKSEQVTINPATAITDSIINILFRPSGRLIGPLGDLGGLDQMLRHIMDQLIQETNRLAMMSFVL